MNKVARRHNFRILLHEKPFKGVNGSRQTQQLVAGHRHGRQPARAGQDAFGEPPIHRLSGQRHGGRLPAQRPAQSLDHAAPPTPTGWERTKRRPPSSRPFWAHRFRPCSINWKRAACDAAITFSAEERVQDERHLAHPHADARQHRPQPHLALRLHGQPLRVPRRGVVGQLRRRDARRSTRRSPTSSPELQGGRRPTASRAA